MTPVHLHDENTLLCPCGGQHLTPIAVYMVEAKAAVVFKCSECSDTQTLEFWPTKGRTDLYWST